VAVLCWTGGVGAARGKARERGDGCVFSWTAYACKAEGNRLKDVLLVLHQLCVLDVSALVSSCDDGCLICACMRFKQEFS